MTRSGKTFIFCYDDHRSFSGEVRDRFSDPDKYHVVVSHNAEEFITGLRGHKDTGLCKIALIGVHDAGENMSALDSLMEEIRDVSLSIKIVLLCVPDRMEAIKKNIRYNADAYIPINSNQTLRTHNIVKRIISEHNLLIFRRRRNRSLYILIGFGVLALAFLIFASIRFSQYF
jgi:DNA-binding NarL/FixJ family response regulator